MSPNSRLRAPLLLAMLCALAAQGVATAAEPARPAAATASSDAGARFKALYLREWTWRQQQSAGADDEDSQGQAADHLPKVDPATQNLRTAYWQQVLRELEAIDPAQLSAQDQVNYQVYRQQLQVLLDQQHFRAWEMPFNSDSAFWSDLGFTARNTLHSREDYQRYLGQLADIPRYFDEQIGNMRAGLARGFAQPKLTLDGRTESIADVAQAQGEDNLFYAPFKQMPATIPPAVQAQLRAQAHAAIAKQVAPAYAKLLRFMREEYLPKTRPALAIESVPDGAAYYRAQIREYTTLDMTPEQIHAVGLKEVARLRKEMDQTIVDSGFKTPAGQQTFPAFLNYLRTDPRFYAKTPEELLKDAAWIAKRVDAKVGDYIGRLPRRRFAIEPVPAELAPFYTGGRGGPGIYLVNTYDLPSRPLYNLTALTLHESSPGHALQMPLAAEQDNLPDFRRYTFISAYGEGWAVYSEYLGQEMGLYDTPYDRFGYLTYQMWRACRLVIDTGIHHYGWTREQAQAYLRDNTALSQHEVTTEVDRYIAWPGQALSYYLGELKIIALRRKAEAALGEKFDIRAFHDAILETGSVPLPVLEQRIDRFIAEGGKSPWGAATDTPTAP
ncbi:DUF885 domain-containing protein [Xanthomonas translucens]|uniref:DUF885 domain-containing protein n=3 Tax=Xanthomonas campestris pv. translucens TaxID=343 RepID=A0A109HK31_XANCT|nr:DUF885 family protein [Xanthomonas translucens]KWV13606.1 hypothetical protein ATB53_15285 [Xanthomonas translucens]KWV16451.1 hypothetical protein ATB54_08140 [Xanthomonas translucens]MCC8447237.1 DUF885 family protein [Xanthomonas translucens pv. translucens]MCS3359238.1 DUF885 family protein [Xanthomonas translucens pv. translucens]MCS3373181.1 DUF885 family protein [Xanthomonas translucens pv. translucens]